MVKRELEEGGGPQAKRRRAESSSSDVAMSEHMAEVNAEEVKEQGMKLWQTVRDGVNKEGRSLSIDFLRKPSKRQYPDYYQLIKHPIALDDIKKQIESGGYSSLEAVRDALELCFQNAKQYNMKESGIWRDAKDLLKLVNKTYHKMVPLEEGDGERKKPNLTRLMKSRLQKLINLTDDSGRVICTEFLALPSKKDWPIYYKTIKRPQCLDNISKQVKRKEYLSAQDFADDVELVFSNALTFNQEHTPIWEDAISLRDHFRQLMADLPPPFTLSQYASPSANKITIKMPPHASPPEPSAIPPRAAPTATSTRASSPRKSEPPVKAVSSTPVAPPAPSLPSSTSINVAQVSSSRQAKQMSSTPQPVPTPVPRPQHAVPYANPAMYTHYPGTSYSPPMGSILSNGRSSVTTPAQTQAHVVASPSVSQSPAPQISPGHQIRNVAIKTEPAGRSFNLDHAQGVKNWALRLQPRETGLFIREITFFGDEEEESSAGEEEDGEMINVEVEAEPPKKRGRGRPPKNPKPLPPPPPLPVKVPQTRTRAAKKKVKMGEVQVKLDGAIQAEKEDMVGSWLVDIPVSGSHVVEIGEKGGLIWKVYVERAT